MKVVLYKSLLDKIDDIINQYGDSIIRIEVTISEFEKLINLIEEYDVKIDNSCIPVQHDLSGSYIVYRGVCIQTHRDYISVGKAFELAKLYYLGE